MILDLSPATVNQTAVWTIANDVREALASRIVRFQYFGREFANIPSPAALNDLRKENMDRMIRDPESIAVKATRDSETPRDMPRYFLDPLYVLFGGVTSVDHVLVHDLSTITHPHWHHEAVHRAYVGAFDLIARQRPRLLAVSHNTADSIYANFGWPRHEITVVPNYVPQYFADMRDQNSTPSAFPYVLFVGSLEARKNLIGAIKSFVLSELGAHGYKLVIVGGAAHGAEAIRAAGAHDPSISFRGKVSNEELGALYAGASAFLYPSYLEGFGVPLLEALYFGVPAVASVTGACPEVGGKLVTYFDPDDHAAFANELIRLTSLTPIERANYATAARQWALGRYSFELFHCNLVEALFGSATASQPTGEAR